MRGKRVQFDDETWEKIDALARDGGKTFQEVAAVTAEDQPYSVRESCSA
jgi:hypothetical protein